jgi:type VI secretion system secreted protein VgrG
MTTNPFALTLRCPEPLDVREFAIQEGMNQLFEVRVTAVSSSHDVDFEAAIGQPARLDFLRVSPVDGETRYWDGICVRLEQLESLEYGLSTYSVGIVPTMWLLTQRRNYRVFQDQSELDVSLAILAEWGITPTLRLDAGSYPKRRMRVQYGETDFDFVNRLLEEIGVAYFFDQVGGSSALVLADAPNGAGPRPPLLFVAQPNERIEYEWATEVRSRREVRPGRVTQSDVDYRKALEYPLAASATQGNGVEAQLERYHHEYGSFLWKTASGGGDTPSADDRGAARTNEKQGGTLVSRRLESERSAARGCTFRTTAHDLRPGKVLTIENHPRAEVAAPLMILTSSLTGSVGKDWTHAVEARYTDVDYRPPRKTPKPRTNGIESATVTGPAGEEIHTDEFGRVRVKFHWDREGANDETSSCWIPQSQPWAGAGFGATSLARVGQEVLIDFLGADPDRPVCIGRVYTTTTPPPYQLPKYKMVTGHRSESYPRPKSGSASPGLGGGPPGEATAATADMVPNAPRGGGLSAVSLGGNPYGGLSNPSTGATGAASNLPGPLAGVQASQLDLSQTVSAFNSAGPDTMDHHRSANGLVHNDTAGKETVYLQAQKDLYETVKANMVATVGQNRVTNIMANDTKRVQFFESTEVGKDRTLSVGGMQVHAITGDIIVMGSQSHYEVFTENFGSTCVNGGHSFSAKKGILLRVDDGKSTILMTPTAIVIDAPKVYINPGETFMKVVTDTHGNTDAAEAAAVAAAADRAAQIKALDAKIAQLQQGQRDLAMGASMSQGGPGVAQGIANAQNEMSSNITQAQAQRAALVAKGE